MACVGPLLNPSLHLPEILLDITPLLTISAVGAAYGIMDEVFKFAATFKEFPTRLFPPSFNTAAIMEEPMDDIKAETKRATETGK